MSRDTDRPKRTLSRWKRWLSLRGYGLVTSALFGATASPLAMRARFERLSWVPRERMQRGRHVLDGGREQPRADETESARGERRRRGGSVGALPAVMNAIIDAFAPLGVKELDMPATGDRVWRAIRTARGG